MTRCGRLQWVAVVVGSSWAISGSGIRADEIRLRGGGTIEGVVLPEADPKSPTLRVLTRTASNPFVFDRAQIVRVETVDDALRTYLDRLENEERTTGEAEFQFATWCVENGLTGPARTHYALAVELDPSHAGAHRKLGHVELDGRWVSYDTLRRSQGLIERGGRWVSKEEAEAADRRDEFAADQASWGRRLNILRRKWLAGDEATRVEAANQLAEIREPAAVVPLLKTFGADPEPVRLRLATILGAIEGPEASEGLVRLVLNEPSEDVRQATLAELTSRSDPELASRFVKALKSNDQLVVGRAAWALAALGDESSVPRMVPVLLKVESQMVLVDNPSPSPGIGVGFTSYGGGGGFSGGSVGAAVPGGGGSFPLGQVGGGSSIPIVTGPVVGQGAVAFGATSVPFGSGASLGINSGANPNRPTTQVVVRYYPNEMVRDALRKLTGRDYAYDQDAWRRWLRSGYQATSTPSRRVPQP